MPLSSAPTATGSLVYLDLTPLGLSAAEFAAIAVSATGWAAQSFPDTQTICLAPTQAVALGTGTAAAITIAVGNFAIAHPRSGNVDLTATYFRVHDLTIGGLGVPSMFKVLLQAPPDRHEDLHQELALTVLEPRVVCSVDAYKPVQNTLTLNFGPRTAPNVPAGSKTTFVVSFVYADSKPGYNALATRQEAANLITLHRGDNADGWDIDKNGASWTLTPPSGALINDNVEFKFSGIETHFAPGPTLMFVTCSDVPGYQKGTFPVLLTKVPHVQINSFEAAVDKDGRNATLKWDVSDAGTLKLSWLGTDKDMTGETTTKVPVTATTKFELTAEGTSLANAGNVAYRSATATVMPVIASFTAAWEKNQLKLDWTTEDADHVEILEIGAQELNGITSFQPSPQHPLPTSFTLKATDLSSGRSVKKRLAQMLYESVSGSGLPRGRQGNCIAVSPDGTRLFFGGADNGISGFLMVFDAETFHVLETATDLGGPCVSVAVSPDGTRVFAGCLAPAGNKTPGNDCLWVLDAGLVRLDKVVLPVGRFPSSVAVSPDGSRIYVGSFVSNAAPSTTDVSRLTRLDAGTLKTVASVDIDCCAVVVSPSGANVFVTARGTLSVLDAWTLAPAQGKASRLHFNSARFRQNFAQAVAVSPDGARLFVGSQGAEGLAVLNTQPLQELWHSPFRVGFRTSAAAVAISHDGARIFVSTGPDLVVLDGWTCEVIPPRRPISAAAVPSCCLLTPRVFSP